MIVLVALVLAGVVFGLAFVYYYDEISNSSTEPGPERPGRDNARHVGDRQRSEKALQTRADAGTLDALSEAVESGAGLPAVARAAARVLDASVALIDRSGAVLAVAGASPDQEKKLLAAGEGVSTIELRVADSVVGELRYRGEGRSPTRRSPGW